MKQQKEDAADADAIADAASRTTKRFVEPKEWKSEADGLSRNAGFRVALRYSGAKFIVAGMPEMHDSTLGIVTLLAEQEREATARRTREALAAAKAREVHLGNPNNGAAAL